ncbi:DUF2723 domain-containing protein [Candidatus Roizmanbacteria bacterium]|nr:DUF2723 domain-containing protein [Candidatus Roizmanbacteria bacterium]
MSKIKRIFLIGGWLLIIGLLIYTRFVGLDWGLPYSMHPDERNMANAVQNLNCSISKLKAQSSNLKECFNPHFFAYGQFPLYLGYFLVILMKFFDGDVGKPISFEEAALSLRLISAVSSILNVFVLMKLVNLLSSNFQFPISKKTSINNYQLTVAFLVFTFSPFFIQFSHFGTTESMLMLLYSVIVYLSLKYSQNKLLASSFYLLISFFAGLAISIKISSVLFLILPILLLIYRNKNTFFARSASVWYLLTLSLVFSILFSPHNFISFPEFLGSMKYESDVAMGSYRAFYTRQFEETIPVFFQIEKIFSYILGWPAFILFLLGLIFLPQKKEFNLLRLAFISVFIPNAFLYAKWTRFMTPILPLMLIMAVLFVFRVIPMKMGIHKIKQSIWIPAFAVMTLLMIIPGIAYLSIYQSPDVRFTASDWIYKNIPENSYLLFETANVVDIPMQSQKSKVKSQNYNMVSFNFYDLDENSALQSELHEHLSKAGYIFIPSRRIFMNQTCIREVKSQMSKVKSYIKYFFPVEAKQYDQLLKIFVDSKCEMLKQKYPLLHKYYEDLFSGRLGFYKVAEFTSYPKIQLFGKTLLEFPDEAAEETWTVFDHPVIRIYKKT